MPPKKTKTSSAVRQRTLFADASTQTEDDCSYEAMVVDYQKQIDALTTKMINYEAVVQKLKDDNEILKRTSVSGYVKNDIVKEKSVSPFDITNKSMKGCGCKGTCGNKICGCVKRGTTCNKALCKCNHVQCRNQESEKENSVSQNELSQEGEQALEKLVRLTLNQEVLHASDKKKKSLFAERENILPASPLSLGTRRRLFKQDSDETVSLSNSDSNVTDKECPNKTDIQLPHTTITKHSKRITNIDEKLKIVITTDEILNGIPSQNELSDMTVNKDDNFLPKIPKVVHSPKEIHQIKSVSPDDFIVRRRYRNDKANEERAMLAPEPTDTTNILDVSLNPMIPKRQLPRSPISAVGNTILTQEGKRFSPPKKELAVAEVNWEQHKSELIMCEICKRTFFPHRIEKHIASCKGI